MIGIIDYGMGNLRSVQKAFERLRVPAIIMTHPDSAASVDKVVLPGVGHFSNGMKNLAERGWVKMLREEVMKQQKPILGICLGMQLLTKHSEEGDVDGLGFIDATTIRFQGQNDRLKIPHMGWNEIVKAKDNELLKDIDNGDMVYFVHSYFVECNKPEDILCKTEYGRTFVSGFQRGHIAGFQFHPEKSHHTGLTLLRNFATL